MFTKSWKCVVASSVMALLALSGVASAVTISTHSGEQDVAYGSIASWGATLSPVNDVLAGLTPTASTGTWPAYEPGYGALGVAALTDGLISPTAETNGSNSYPFTYADDGHASTSPTANTVTYTFDATKLDTIVVYGGHVQGDSGLARQNYTVEGSADGGATWTTLGATNYMPTSTGSGHSLVVKTTLSDDGLGSAVLGADGLTLNALRISFGTSGNGYYGCGYLEVAAYKAVPEPSTLALLAVGLVSLLAYAWRKQK